MYTGEYHGHVYKQCTRKRCPDCDGRGIVLDAPADVLSGRAYETECETCGGAGHTRCTGCRGEGFDCTYQALSVCGICGAFEGGLLPFCPGRALSYEEIEAHYKHYCAATGPFARQTIVTVEGAWFAVQTYWAQCTTDGRRALLDAVADLRYLTYRQEATL